MKYTISSALIFLMTSATVRAQEPPQLTNDQWKTAVQSYRSQLAQADSMIGDLNAQLAIEHEQVINLQASQKNAQKQSQTETCKGPLD